MQDCLVDTLKCLCSLTHLRLVFDYDIEIESRAVDRPVSEPESVRPQGPGAPFEEDEREHENEEDWLEYVAHETDLRPAAIRLVDAGPSLQYVSLTTCGERRYKGAPGSNSKYWHSSKAWRVVGRRGGAHEDLESSSSTSRLGVVEVTKEEAEAVMDREELRLRDREEVSVAFGNRTRVPCTCGTEGS